MATLEKRIAALESKASPGGDMPDTIFLVDLMPGNKAPDIRKLRQSDKSESGKEWERGADETEEDFKGRASREASRRNGFALLVQCD